MDSQNELCLITFTYFIVSVNKKKLKTSRVVINTTVMPEEIS